MKSFLFCCGVLVGGVIASCGTAKADTMAPTTLSRSEVAYCERFAEREYSLAVERGEALPDAFYEGAEEQCEVEWLVLAAQWDDPDNMNRVAVLALGADCGER